MLKGECERFLSDIGVDDADGSRNSDHADWGDARVIWRIKNDWQ